MSVVTVGKLVSQLVGLLAAGCRATDGSNHLQMDTLLQIIPVQTGLVPSPSR